MSQYNLVVQWSSKDALADNNPDKVVSGDDFNTEFLAVKSAINSKADLTENTQIITAATASAGTNTNQVATTAFVTAAMTAATINNLVYPVGSVYVNATVSTNPATLLGVGTWVAYGEGRVPVGKAGSGTFDTLGATGGAETHTLTLNEIPSHNHNNGSYQYLLLSNGSATIADTDSTSGEPNLAQQGAIQAAGGGAAHNNLQPYIVVYMWKRTA